MRREATILSNIIPVCCEDYADNIQMMARVHAYGESPDRRSLGDMPDKIHFRLARSPELFVVRKGWGKVCRNLISHCLDCACQDRRPL